MTSNRICVGAARPHSSNMTHELLSTSSDGGRCKERVIELKPFNFIRANTHFQKIRNTVFTGRTLQIPRINQIHLQGTQAASQHRTTTTCSRHNDWQISSKSQHNDVVVPISLWTRSYRAREFIPQLTGKFLEYTIVKGNVRREPSMHPT